MSGLPLRDSTVSDGLLAREHSRPPVRLVKRMNRRRRDGSCGVVKVRGGAAGKGWSGHGFWG